MDVSIRCKTLMQVLEHLMSLLAPWQIEFIVVHQKVLYLNVNQSENCTKGTKETDTKIENQR